MPDGYPIVIHVDFIQYGACVNEKVNVDAL
jgi:hypothetical protein